MNQAIIEARIRAFFSQARHVVVTLPLLFLAQVLAPKGFDVYAEREVQIQQNLALEITRRILTSGALQDKTKTRRYKALRDVQQMAQLLYQHADLVRGRPPRSAQQTLVNQGRLGNPRP